MTGDFKLYDAEYASTSKTGWYEAYRSGAREWIILECYPDGSCSKRTFEENKSAARSTVNRLNDYHECELPHYVDHGVKYYHKTI